MSCPLRTTDLDQFTGSEHWYRHPLYPSITYTDGAHHVAEAGGAFWLLDAIVSHQHDARVRREEFQIWTLQSNVVQCCETETCNASGADWRLRCIHFAMK